jgi:hypothetical protein
MKKTLILISFCISTLYSVHLQAQTCQWAKNIGGSGGYPNGQEIALDIYGNVYTTGYFSGTVDFDPGAGLSNLTSFGDDDIFVSKLDASGNFVWSKHMGSSTYDRSYSIAVDSFGNVYTTGFFSGIADFDPGLGTFNLISNSYPQYNEDIFISKLDSNGNFVWAKSFGDASWDCGNSIKIDNEGNVYTTGLFAAQVDFDPGTGTFYLMSNSYSYDIFISKLDAGGNFIWAKKMGGSYSDGGSDILVDINKNIYIIGSFQDTTDFDPGVDTFNLISNGSYDFFISKLDSIGNFLWATGFGGSNNDGSFSSFAVDLSGNIYLASNFYDTIDFDPGPGIFNMMAPNGYDDIFILKLDATGGFLWARQMGGLSVDYSNSISLDASGNIFITGSFCGTADFDPGPGIFNLSTIIATQNDNDIFISILDANGNFIWAKNMGGTGLDYGRSIALDAVGNNYITGTFKGQANFDFQSPIILTSNGLQDVFIAKYSNTIVGKTENNFNESLNVFPNPATNTLYINGFKNTASAEIYDISSKLLLSKQLNKNHLNISSLAKGLYFIKLSTAEVSVVRKFVKE